MESLGVACFIYNVTQMTTYGKEPNNISTQQLLLFSDVVCEKIESLP